MYDNDSEPASILKRRLYSNVKTKTTDLQVELFVNKIYIMCISPFYACQ